jgi:hypothetical protein
VKTRNDAILIWVCMCCMLSHANGECCADDGHGGDGIEPWSDVNAQFEITMGLFAEEHHEECQVRITGDWPVNYECECASNEFSTSKCDGCGSWLAGSRYAFALWPRSSV